MLSRLTFNFQSFCLNLQSTTTPASLIFKMYFLKLCAYVYAVPTEVTRGHQTSPELELQVVVKFPTSMLRSQLEPYTNAASAANL